MKKLFFALSLACISAFGAAGDITGATVLSNGWQLQIVIDGVNTNGTYNTGLTANVNAPATAKGYVDLVSQGFDDTGAATTISRRVYITKNGRLPHPNSAVANETDLVGSVALVVNLSEFVYGGDSNLTLTLAGSFYSQGGTPNNAIASLAVTNSSTLGYPDVVGNWSWANLQRVTNTTARVRCVAYHPFGQQGRPVRAVKFTLTDQNSHTATVTVTNLTVDRTLTEPYPLAEYLADIDVSAFTAKDTLTYNFIAYPWVGTNVLNSASPPPVASGYRVPLANQTAVYDPINTYGVTVAIVDPTNGNDGTANAKDISNLATVAPCLTGAKALQLINAFNNSNNARNNAGAGIVYLTNGTHTLWGTTASSPTTCATYLTVMPHPNADPSTILVNFDTTRANRKPRTSALRFFGLTNIVQNFDNDAFTMNNASDYLMFENCWVQQWTNGTINPVSTYTNTFSMFTTNWCKNNVANAVGGRGNRLTNVKFGGYIERVFSSDYQASAGQTSAMFSESAVSAATLDNGIMANCRIQTVSTAVQLNSGPKRYGIAFVNCVMEKYTADAQPLMQLNSDGILKDTTNVMILNCTFAGDRNNIAYNDSGSAAVWAINWHVKNSVFYYFANKSDTFTTANGNRIGNWAVVNGVGCSGNVTKSNSFLQEYPGLNSKQNVSSEGFILDASKQGTSAGGGTYRITSVSELVNWPSEWLIAYDHEGNNRGLLDPPGAFSSAIPKKGGLFFAN
jgi:hypothetical protein